MGTEGDPRQCDRGDGGAFLGSLTGVACIVLVSKLGYVAAISGVVMAVCAIKAPSYGPGALTELEGIIGLTMPALERLGE